MNMYILYKNIQPINGGMFMERQKIKCDVHDCMHCNCDKDVCLLKKIKVSSSSPLEEKEATMCASYKKA